MDEKYRNLLVVLKIFQNRPHHLSNFLLENGALTNDFLNKISNSDKLSEIANTGVKDNFLHFNSISEMKSYYTSLIDDLDGLGKKKSKEEVAIHLNEKLQNAIDREDYDEASRIRDYMRINNIKKF